MNVQNHKFILYNFPTKSDSKNYNINLSPTFINLKCFISNKTNYSKQSKYNEYNAILDSGSYCNFISTNLINHLKLDTHQTLHPVQIKGISGSTIINQYVYLKFNSKIYKSYLFREKSSDFGCYNEKKL